MQLLNASVNQLANYLYSALIVFSLKLIQPQLKFGGQN